MARLMYTLALWLLLPFVLLRLLWRARKQPEYLRHVGERFGFYLACTDAPTIWLHAVSVGETRATQSLVAKLQADYPDHRILLTHATPTGRAAGEQLYGDRVRRVYLPYDYPFAVRRFLRHFRPELGILMETEIWPNLIHAAREQGVPMLLLNARLSEKSARGYGRFADLAREALANLSTVAAQTADDAARLAALGAKHVTVMGNLKFDIEAPAAMLHLGCELRERFGGERIFLAASTREGEEVLLLDALWPGLSKAGWRFVIVPRHPQRFDEVAAMFAQRGIPYRRRSRLEENDAPLILGDSMGEMFAYYAAADLAFIGGSLLPLGGQNLIEACAVGTPVLVGPHTFNFAEATRRAVQAGAARQVADAAGLAEAVRELIAKPEAISAMREAGTAFVAGNRGATDAALEVIQNNLGR